MQDPDKNRAYIHALANWEGLGQVEFVEKKASGRIAWRKRRIADIPEELREGDVPIVGELSRLGRSLLECMEFLSIAANAGIRVHAIKGSWRLDETIQSRIIAMASSMAAEVERNLLSARTRAALRARKASGRPLGRPKGPRQEQARSVSSRDQGSARERFDPEIHCEALQHDARQPRELDEGERDQEAKGMRILWRIRHLCWVLPNLLKW